MSKFLKTKIKKMKPKITKLIVLLNILFNAYNSYSQTPTMGVGNIYMVNLTSVSTASCSFTNPVCWKRAVTGAPLATDPSAVPNFTETCFIDIDNLGTKTFTVGVSSNCGNLIITDGPLPNSPSAKILLSFPLEVKGNNTGTAPSTLCIAPTASITGTSFFHLTSMGGSILTTTIGTVIKIPNLTINSSNYLNSFNINDSIRCDNFFLDNGFFNSNGERMTITNSFQIGNSSGFGAGTPHNTRINLNGSIVDIFGLLSWNFINTLVPTTLFNYSGTGTQINIRDFDDGQRHFIGGKINSAPTFSIESITNFCNKPFTIGSYGIAGNQIPIGTINSVNSFQAESLGSTAVGFKISTLQVDNGLVYFHDYTSNTIANRFEINNLFLGSGCSNNSILLDGNSNSYVWLNSPVTINGIGIKNLTVGGSILTCSNSVNLGNNSGTISFIGSLMIGDYYWRGGTNSNWNTVSNWYLDPAFTLTTACLPGFGSNVHFTDPAISHTVITDGATFCRDMLWENTTSAFTFTTRTIYPAGGNNESYLGNKIYVNGNLNFPISFLNFNNKNFSSFTFCGSATHSITSNRSPFKDNVFFYGTGLYVLSDSLKLDELGAAYEGSLWIYSGNFNSNSQVITTGKFYITGLYPKNVNLINSDLYIINNCGTSFRSVDIVQTGSLTYTANNATNWIMKNPGGTNSIFHSNLQNTLLGSIFSRHNSDGIVLNIINGRQSTASTNPLIFHRVVRERGDIYFSPLNIVTYTPGPLFRMDSLCFRNNGSVIFSGEASGSPSYSVAITQAILTSTGCINNYKITGINGSIVITPTLVFSSPQNVRNTVIENIVATGATANAVSSVTLGTSSGWTFTPPTIQDFYWTGEGKTADWNDWHNWKLNTPPLSGYLLAGTDTVFNLGHCLPSFSDNVFFHANSFPRVDSVNILSSVSFNDMTWINSGAGAVFGTPKKVVANNITLNVYGSLLLSGMMNNSFFKSDINFLASDIGNVISSRGAIFNGSIISSPMDFKFIGSGQWQITDSLIARNVRVFHSSGNLDASSTATNTVHIDCHVFNSTTSFTRTLNISGTLIDAFSWGYGLMNFGLNSDGLTFIHNAETYVRLGKGGGISGGTLYQTVNISGTNPLPFNGKIRFLKAAASGYITQSTTMGVSKFHNVIFDNIDGLIGKFISSSPLFDNEFDSLTFSPDGGYKLSLAHAKTLRINNVFDASGILCRHNTIQSTLPATHANLCGTGGLTLRSSYIDLQDINSASCLGFVPSYSAVVNSVDLGNNTGWNFGPTFSTLPGFGANPTLGCNQYPAMIPTTGFFTTPSTSYLWNNGSTNDSLPITSPGTYSLTVTYGTSCFITGSTTYSLNNNLTATVTPSNVKCNLGSTGSATLGITNQSPSTNYTWNLAAAGLGTLSSVTSTVVTGLTAGNYSVTANDPNCPNSYSFSIIEPTAFTVTPTTNSVSCFGAATGSGSVLVNGATPAYTYSWAPSIVSTTNIATGLNASTIYTVTVNDANNCVTSRTLSVNQPTSALTSTISGISNVLCYGANTGSASILATGGTGVITYSWMPGAITTSLATSLIANNYTVSVSDANGCISSKTLSITQPTSALTSTISGVNNVLCYGASTGSASVLVSGGTGAITYSWIPGAITTSTIGSLGAGSYSLLITDANNCTDNKIFSITQPTSALTTTFSSINNVLCYGASTGSATALVSGGTGAVSYSWIPGGITTSTIGGVSAGIYTLTVMDLNNCIDTKTISITQPASALTSTLIALQDVLCFGAATGSATVVSSGGTGTPTYSWLPSGISTSTISGLLANNYTVAVIDANGCVDSKTLSINQPSSAISIASLSTNSVLCYGASSGSITLNVVGGIPSYTTSWSGPSTFTSITTGSLNTITAPAGTFTAIVMDANGCIVTTTAVVSEPISSVSVSLSGTITPTACTANTGEATVNSSGGTGVGYNYTWLTPIGTFTTSTATYSNLPIGTTTVSVFDANNCISNTITLNVTALGSPTVVIITNSVLCNGGNGSAVVNVTGVAPFSYTWQSSSSVTSNSGNLVAGTYSVLVNEISTGCKTIETFTINEPSVLSTAISNVLNIDCFGGANGSASVTPVGGTPVYSFNWLPIGGTSSLGVGLSQGFYTVITTDANNCSKSNTVEILSSSQDMTVTVTNTIAPDCGQFLNGAISINADGGSPNYTYLWSNGNTTANNTNISDGTYTVIVTDSHNCTKQLEIALDCFTALFIPEILSPNGDGKNDKLEIKGIYKYPNNKVTIFNRWGSVVYYKEKYNNEWDGKPNVSTITGNGLLPSGTYYIVIDFGDEEKKTHNGFVQLEY